MNDTDPIQITVNDELISIPRGLTIAQLLRHLNLKTRAIAVERNQKIQPANCFERQVIEPHDVLEIVTLVGGG